jgi:hypothetical protein
VIVLPCRCWSCENCAYQRRRNLIFDAAAGAPTALLTLTVNPTVGSGPVDRAQMLQEAFVKLRKLIVKQLQKPPGARWQLQKKDRHPDKQRQVDRYTGKTPAEAKPRIAWFGFMERTKLGEPHAHILLRAPFIPQDWISEQMERLIAAPIVWIEAIEAVGKAVRYVTKYVGKAPAQFGKLKRYWQSHNWLTEHRERRKIEWKRGTYTVRRTNWRDFIQDRLCQGWSWYVDIGDLFHFTRPEFSCGAVGLRSPPADAAGERRRDA